MTAILCSEVSALFSCSSRFVTAKYITIAEKLQDEFRLFEANGRSSAVTIDGTCGVPYNIGLLLGIGPEGREREKEERDPQ